jgi:hypothetical protein
MKRFGDFLLEKGAIKSEQLDEARQCQVAFGGRLGTNLVELGYLSMDDVARLLSEHEGVAVPDRAWLEWPNAQALKSVPLALVQRLKVLPFDIDARVIHVAMLDPLNPAHSQDISFATSRNVQPYLLPELQLHHWLERHYGIKREIRYINIGIEQARGRFTEEEQPPEPPPYARSGDIAPQAEGLVEPLRKEQELTDERTFETTYAAQIATGSQAAQAAPLEPQSPAPIIVRGEPTTPPRASIASLESILLNAEDRDAIIGASLSLATHYADFAALFIVHQGLIQGVRCQRANREPRPLEAIILPLKGEGLIAQVAASGETRRSKIGADELDQRVLRALGRQDAIDVALLPVKIRGRVVNVLYVDNKSEPLAVTAFAGLSALPGLMADAYERLILERKRL